jgi:hypothetical protein
MRLTRCFLRIVALPALLIGSLARADDKDKEWKDLFNGKDMTGWTYFLNDENAKMEDVWSVQDGVIICKGKPTGYIKTEEKYTNYELTLEWRFNPDKGAGNSGVLLRQVGEDKIWPKSVEAQLFSKNAGDIWNIGEFPLTVDPARTKERRTLKLKETNEKPLGEWNKYEITVKGGDLKLVVNGELQNEATGFEEVEGTICLQSEGAEIHFRNIKIRELED